MVGLQTLSKLRQASRQLVRELGMLQIQQTELPPSHWHTLIECQDSMLTISQLSKRLLLEISTTSRIVDNLVQNGYLSCTVSNHDKRSKMLSLTDAGINKVKEMDSFSNRLITNAFTFLDLNEQNQIVNSIQGYANALSKSRISLEKVKLKTLNNDRGLRHRIMDMIYDIQHHEFGVNISPEVNESILKAENYYYFNGKCNFWYAIDENEDIVGTIGLCKVNSTYAELKKCFVKPHYRGKGLSERLVHKLIKQADKLRIQYIIIGTISTFVWAHKFYQKCGFTMIDESLLPKEFEKCEADSVFLIGKVDEVLTHMNSRVMW